MPPKQIAHSKGIPLDNSVRNARTNHRVPPKQISKVLCHREFNDIPQFLVRWRTGKEPLVPPRAVCSWHDLDELSEALHFVQAYLDDLPAPGSITTRKSALPQDANPLKRKAPGAASRDEATSSGLLTPLPSHLSLSRSPSPSVSSLDLAFENDEQPDWRSINVYNGILQRKEGRIYPKKPRFAKVTTVNASKLPSDEMKEHAAATPGPITAAERLIRNAFMEKLRSVPGVYLENQIDNTTPSLDFTFIDKFLCECLEYAAVDEPRLAKKDPARHAQYLEKKRKGGFPDTDGLPKRFPYSKPKPGFVQTLNDFYREERHAIYECNEQCNCGPGCKSHLVNKGRHVNLTIFKTANRGWGVCCNENLIQGEFIDVYLGEVLTNEETSRREDEADSEKGSYLYSLDKFIEDDPTLTAENCYVVDGQYMGNATRFINHSCEPNCRQYTVSYNKYDLRVYNLAFFAYEDIPAGTELTFDYMDKDEEEEEDVLRKREEAMNDPANEDKRPCNCGASKCRGYLWV
ncbi:hypothetical protein MBLNU13_g09137t2 [Cladosporium sp. NU13]